MSQKAHERHAVRRPRRDRRPRRASPRNDDRSPSTDRAPQSAGEPPSRRRASILVIEDDDGSREALAELLSSFDYDVSAARDGTDALPLVTSNSPDLVVMDWLMPRLSGVPLCRALRRLHKDLPIIVVTSTDEPFDGKPVNAALRKPIDPPQLHRVIQLELPHASHL